MHLLHLDLSRLLRSAGNEEEADKILENARKFGYKGFRGGRGPDRQRFGERPLRPSFQQKRSEPGLHPKPESEPAQPAPAGKPSAL